MSPLLLLALSNFPRALITAASIGSACAVLSVIVVLRRWAFIGEGIAHAGFGGLGTGWLLSLAFPALAGPGSAYGVAVVFCLAVGLAIAWVTFDRGSRGERFGADSAIGIFMGASLAWGFLALALYGRHGHAAPSAEDYLFGTMDFISPAMMKAGVAVSLGVVVCVAALFKEIVYYTFDPLMARVGGVRTGVIHGLLMLLVTLTIVVAMKIAGNVLVTALLVLPGATALMVTCRLGRVIAVAVIVSLVACVAGPVINRRVLPSFPSGPAIVMVLFVEFVIAGVGRLLVRTPKPE